MKNHEFQSALAENAVIRSALGQVRRKSQADERPRRWKRLSNVGQLCPEIMTLNLDSSATQGGDTGWEIPMTLDAFEMALWGKDETSFHGLA